MSSNEGVVIDEDGDFSDWVELYNNGIQAVSLLGYGITDDPDEAYKWTFPDVVLEPASFLLVFCSGKDRLFGPFLHTNFSIKKSGEPLLLTDADGNTADSAQAVSLATNFSFGRVSDGVSYWERFDEATPGGSNESVHSVLFSAQSGGYPEALELELFSAQDGNIYYTTDGSVPDENANLYDGSIVLESIEEEEPDIAYISTSINWQAPSGSVRQAHVIRACVYQNGVPVSRTYSKTYLIGPEFMANEEPYPIISIQTAPDNLFDEEIGIFVPGLLFESGNPEWTGNFFQRGQEWERDVSFEVIEEGELRWAQDAGMRIHGGKTRNAPQKSLRLYARHYHGANKFHDRIFETKDKTVFDKFLLRGHFGCWNKTMIKDGLSAHIVKDLDFDVQHVKPAVVFINGVYWGMFAFRDYYDSNYFEEEYEVEKDDVNILVHGSGIRPGFDEDWGIVEGDNEHYLALMDFIENNSLEEEENFQYVTTQLDVESMVDFYCTAIYFNHYDWPSNNHKVWRADGDSRWRWLMYDFDSAWGYRPLNTNTFLYASNPEATSIYNTPYTTWLFRKLLESDSFKAFFAQRYACLLNSTFEQESVEEAIDYFVDMYTPGFPEHNNRWNNNSSQAAWNSAIDNKLYAFNDGRLEYAIEHASLQLGFVFDPDDYECSDDPIVHVAAVEDEVPELLSYPNPASSFIWVDAPQVKSSAELSIFNAHGALMHKETYRFHMRVDVSKFSRGMYVIVLDDGQQRQVSRLLKQ